ncbi:hypothetical protein LCGC14_2420630, partial [marine sediment metagenome]
KESSQEEQPITYFRKRIRKYNISLTIGYIKLLILMVPTNLAFFSLIYWINLFPALSTDATVFNTSLIFYIFLSVIYAFIGPYYYFSHIRKIRMEKATYGMQMKSQIFQKSLKWFSKHPEIGKNLLKYGSVALIVILYAVYFYFSLPTRHIIFMFILVLYSLYFEYFLTKHIVRGHISTISRQVFTCVIIIGIIFSSAFFFFNENMKFILFTIPVFILVSSAEYKFGFIEKIGGAFLTVVNKIGLIKLGIKLKTLIEKLYHKIKASKKRGMIIKCLSLAMVGGIIYLIYNFNYAASNIILSFILLSVILVLCLIYLSVLVSYNTNKFTRISYRSKLTCLWIFLVAFFIVYAVVFILWPQFIYLPVLATILIIFIFAKKNASKAKDSNQVIRESKNVRPVLLIAFFLILMPFCVFSISSIVRLYNPDMQYAKISQESRIEGASIDYSQLEYYTSVDGLNELSFNSKFISRSQITTALGEVATMSINLVPENVTPVEGHRLRDSYYIKSKYVSGPRKNYDLITHVPLDS